MPAKKTAAKRPARKATTKRTTAKPSVKKAAARTASTKPATLNAAQQAEYEACSNAGFKDRKKAPVMMAAEGRTALRQFVVVAEGDSWFDYKPAFLGGKDLLGHLQSSGRINVYRVSKAGDTMENMVYGTDTSGKGTGMKPALPPQLEKTLKAILDKNADAFFFSGGGNDLAGVELASYLNHKTWGQPVIRKETLDFIFGIYFAKALKDLISAVRKVKPGLPIFLHGYDYAVPDGRDVSFLGFNFSGPWLKPALVQKRRTDPAEGIEIMVKVLDAFNAALKKVAADHSKVYYIDLRKTLRNGANYKDDWANELHPTSNGFQRLAKKIEAVMLEKLP
ncbi:GDSL-type esterase/lipase family protein [Luteolibacter luteus]|uniref:SGNH hydrolase-type esterase domain-containing protein n=1 Tax=Luteolibacter luteus TaxID=2728835 RepID=A0A858RLH8_9BACT|nr:GDSL-type esterase/lipase family protein [Luteolibacter luteus]QJE96843.1 hypothetical protein HHL09_13965 [Luteolibacter luteus]